MGKEQPSQKKYLFMEQFISIVLIFRNQLSNLNPMIYYSIVVIFLVGKKIKQGNTAGSPLQYLSLLILVSSDLLSQNFLSYLGVMIALFNSIFVSPTVYTLPQYNPKVGIRENYSKRNNKQLYWVEWFPISQSQKQEVYQISWSHTVEINKIAQYLRLKNNFMIKVFKFFTNITEKYQLTLAKGAEGKSKGVILFSHGRVCTPFMYSSILKNFARNWRIICPQHSQVPTTPYKDLKEIKRFRESQVKERGSQIEFLTSQIKQDEEIVLMGHSYGCPTVLQAYHGMDLNVKKRVTHIVLLDPSFFPLPQNVIQQQISCPILMLSNQHFLKTQEIYERNITFIKINSRLLYICWKNADHLHHTDLPFIIGSTLGKIKNSKESSQIHERNIEAIDIFLKSKKFSDEQKEQFFIKFKQWDLGKEFKPESFVSGFIF